MRGIEVREVLRTFAAERAWSRFYSPENLASSITLGAGELLECFQWPDDPAPAEVQDEFADVLTHYFSLADRLDLDPREIVFSRLKQTRRKYPVERSPRPEREA